MPQETVDQIVRAAVGRSLADWIADGREAYRPVVEAIGVGGVTQLVINRLADSPDYAALLGALAKGERGADLIEDLVALAKTALSAMLAAGVFVF